MSLQNLLSGKQHTTTKPKHHQLLGTDEQSQQHQPLTSSKPPDPTKPNHSENFTSAFKMMKNDTHKSKIVGRVFGKVLQTTSRPSSRNELGNQSFGPASSSHGVDSGISKDGSTHDDGLFESSSSKNNKRTTFKPNPKERLWNPSPSKKPRSGGGNTRVEARRVDKDRRGRDDDDDDEGKSNKAYQTKKVGRETRKRVDKENMILQEPEQSNSNWPTTWTNNSNFSKLSNVNITGVPSSFASIQFPKQTQQMIDVVVTTAPQDHVSVTSNQLILPNTTRNSSISALPPSSSAVLLQTGTLGSATSSDLNNSFTEKISNLDLGAVVGGSLSFSTTENNETEKSTIASSLNLESTSVLSASTVEPNYYDNNDNQNDKENGGKRNNKEPVCSKAVDGRLPLQPKYGAGHYWFEQLDPAAEYLTDILNYWHTLETENVVKSDYMEHQKEVSYKMRTILVDWLVEVVEEYSIGSATLHRAVQFVDRFLSKYQISRSNLQLLGTACLFIACKIEEIHPPETGDLVYITDNTYDKAQLLHMECVVLSVLDFDLLTPTAYDFTEYFSSTLFLNPTAKEFSYYIVELTLLYGETFLKYYPSVIGLAGAYVAIKCCGDSGWHYAQVARRRNSSCRKNYTSAFGNRSSSNNNNRYGSDTTTNDSSSVASIISRVKRLNPQPDFITKVEQVVSEMFIVLMSVSGAGEVSISSNTVSNNTLEISTNNSVCTKYKKFQEQKYFVAAASAAACFPSPWHDSLIK